LRSKKVHVVIGEKAKNTANYSQWIVVVCLNRKRAESIAKEKQAKHTKIKEDFSSQDSSPFTNTSLRKALDEFDPRITVYEWKSATYSVVEVDFEVWSQ